MRHWIILILATLLSLHNADGKVLTKKVGSCGNARQRRATYEILVAESYNNLVCRWDIAPLANLGKNSLVFYKKKIDMDCSTSKVVFPGEGHGIEVCQEAEPYCIVYTQRGVYCDESDLQEKIQSLRPKCTTYVKQFEGIGTTLDFYPTASDEKYFTLEMNWFDCVLGTPPQPVVNTTHQPTTEVQSTITATAPPLTNNTKSTMTKPATSTTKSTTESAFTSTIPTEPVSATNKPKTIVNSNSAPTISMTETKSSTVTTPSTTTKAAEKETHHVAIHVIGATNSTAKEDQISSEVSTVVEKQHSTTSSTLIILATTRNLHVKPESRTPTEDFMLTTAPGGGSFGQGGSESALEQDAKTDNNLWWVILVITGGCLLFLGALTYTIVTRCKKPEEIP